MDPKSSETSKFFKAKLCSTEGARILVYDQGLDNPSIGGGILTNYLLDGDLAEARARAFDQSRDKVNYLIYLVLFLPLCIY